MRHIFAAPGSFTLALCLCAALPPAARAGQPNGRKDVDGDYFWANNIRGNGLTVGQVEVKGGDFAGVVYKDHNGWIKPNITNRDYFQGATGAILPANTPHGLHATNVASVMISNAGTINGHGLIPDAKLVNARVEGEAADIIRAVSDFTNYATNPTDHLALKLPIINISIYDGGETAKPTDGTGLDVRALDWLVADQNLVLVNISGNVDPTALGGLKKMRTPGDTYNSITVGATKRQPTPLASSPSFGDWAPFSRTSTTDDERDKPDIVAPGEDIKMIANTGVNAYNTASGTSFAAPSVTAGIALIREANEKVLFKPAAKAAMLPNANHHLTLKSALMTGAFKTKGWTATSPQNPLDYRLGAGEMKLKATQEVFVNGEQPTGNVKANGFHLGTTAAAAANYDYALPADNTIRKGAVVIGTVAWDRTLTRTAVTPNDNDLSNDTFTPIGPAPVGKPLGAPVRNIDLQLFKNGGAMPERESISPRGNVEHISYTAGADKEKLVFRVKDPGNGGGYDAAQKYAMTWRVDSTMITGRGSADLAEFTPETHTFGGTDLPTVFHSYGSSPTAIAMASPILNTGLPTDPFVFTGDMAQQKLRVFNDDGSERSMPTASPLVGPRDLAFNSAGNLYVALDDPNPINSDKIVQLDPFTGQTIGGPIAPGLADPHGLFIDVDNDMWVAETGTSTITQLDPNGGHLFSFATPGVAPIDLAWDSMGTLWVAANSTTQGEPSELIQFDAEGSILFEQELDGIFDVRSLAINPFDGNIFVSGADRILAYSVDGILMTDLSDPMYGIDNGGGIAFTLQEFGGSPLVVPEPGSIALFALAGAMLARRKRR